MQSTQESYTLDDIGYSNLISCLESMTPFEAIRQAEEINKVNGFEVVSRVTIAEWKKGIMKFQNEKNENEILNFKSHFEISNIEIDFLKNKSRKLHKDSNWKREYQKAYMKIQS